MSSIYLYINMIHNYSIRFSRPHSPEAYGILLFYKERIGVGYIKIKMEVLKCHKCYT
jgi:hypothetical protein